MNSFTRSLSGRRPKRVWRPLTAALGGVLALTSCAQGTASAPPSASVATATTAMSSPATTTETPSESASPTPSQVPNPTTSSSSTSTSSTSTTSRPTTTGTSSCPAAPTSFVRSAPGSGKTVALTFDDGPSSYDQQIVDILQRYGVHATFFMTGKNAEARPAIVKQVSAAGNLIADHSWEHRYPSAVSGGWTASYVTSEMTRTRDKLSSLTGLPICFYRPPGGYTTNVLKAAGPLRLTVAMWSIDTLDWEQPGTTTAAATAAIVKAATAAGDQSHPIVLMHSAKASHEPDSQVSPYRGNTVAALPAIIEWYQEHGYRFVRMDGKQ